QVRELAHLLLDVRERLALHRAEADRARAGRGEPGGRLELDRRRRQREQVVELRLDRLGPAEQHVEEAHYRRPLLPPGLTSPSWRWIFSSCSMRLSRDGWVEKSADRLRPPLPPLPPRVSRMAGAK